VKEEKKGKNPEVEVPQPLKGFYNWLVEDWSHVALVVVVVLLVILLIWAATRR